MSDSCKLLVFVRGYEHILYVSCNPVALKSNLEAPGKVRHEVQSNNCEALPPFPRCGAVSKQKGYFVFCLHFCSFVRRVGQRFCSLTPGAPQDPQALSDCLAGPLSLLSTCGDGCPPPNDGILKGLGPHPDRSIRWVVCSEGTARVPNTRRLGRCKSWL